MPIFASPRSSFDSLPIRTLALLSLICYPRRHARLGLLFRYKRSYIGLVTRTSNWMILPKHSLVHRACSLVQSKGFGVATSMCEEVSKTR
jgi:hypothetical protein